MNRKKMWWSSDDGCDEDRNDEEGGDVMVMIKLLMLLMTMCMTKKMRCTELSPWPEAARANLLIEYIFISIIFTTNAFLVIIIISIIIILQNPYIVTLSEKSNSMAQRLKNIKYRYSTKYATLREGWLRQIG